MAQSTITTDTGIGSDTTTITVDGIQSGIVSFNVDVTGQVTLVVSSGNIAGASLVLEQFLLGLKGLVVAGSAAIS